MRDTRPLYSYLATEAALCLWEAVCAPDGSGPWPWEPFKEKYGTMALRRAIIDLADICSADWFILAPDQQGFGNIVSFDWEYCPLWLSLAVQWENADYGDYPKARPESERLEIMRNAG